MTWLVASGPTLWQTAAKAALMYAAATLALRLGERRTLAQWTIIDFATAVAIGAVVGRTAVAKSQAFVVGAVAVATLVLVHRLASVARFSKAVRRVVDHPVRVLVVRGEVRRAELRRCGLTDEDLFAQLRQRGVASVRSLRFVLYEKKGGLTVVPDEPGGVDSELVRAALDDAAGYP